MWLKHHLSCNYYGGAVIARELPDYFTLLVLPPKCKAIVWHLGKYTLFSWKGQDEQKHSRICMLNVQLQVGWHGNYEAWRHHVTKTLANREHISRIKRQLPQLDNTAEKQAGLNFGKTWMSMLSITFLYHSNICSHQCDLQCFSIWLFCECLQHHFFLPTHIKLCQIDAFLLCILCLCPSFFNLRCFFA